ncbi:putative ribonuclease H-like domain-containing protein [Tanacetum coccineum]
MDPVICCTTLPIHSRSLKGFLFDFSRRSMHFYRLSHSELDDIEKDTNTNYACSSHTVITSKISRVLRIILVVLPEHLSDTKVFTMKMEILLELTSNKLLVGLKVTTLHGGNTTTRLIKRFTMADDHNESSKITQVKGTTLKDYYKIKEEDEEDNEVNKVVGGDTGNEGAGGSTDMCRNMSQVNVAGHTLTTVEELQLLIKINVKDDIQDLIDQGLGSTNGIRACALRNFDLEVMEFESAQSNTTDKLPILKLDSGTSVTKMSVPVTAKEKTNKKNDVKARSLLLMALPNEHQLTFSQYTDAKTMLQKLVSRLEILGVVITQEDLNSKFLRSLPPEWNTHVVVWMNKADIETMSIDDFISSTNDVNTANSNVNTASPQTSSANISDNVVYAFMVKNPNGSNLLQKDLEQIHEDDLEAMDLKWQLSLLIKDNTRKQGNNEDTSSKVMLAIYGVGFDWSDMEKEQIQKNMALMAFSDSEVYNDKTCTKTCLKNNETLKKQCDDLIVKLNETEFKVARGLAIVEEQLVSFRKNEVLFSEEIEVLKREVGCKDYELGMLKTEYEKVKQEKEGIDFKIAKFDNASKYLDKLLESQITDKSKKGIGYHAVAPPYPISLNAPTKLDLSYSDTSKENTNDSLVHEQVSENKNSYVESSPNVDKETIFHTVKKVEFVKPKNNEKPVRKSVRYAEIYRSQSPRGNQRNWNGQKSNQLGSNFVLYNKACFVCGSFDHVQYNYPHHQRNRMVNRNNYNRVDYDYYAKTSHPSTHRNMTPKAVLLKSSLKPLSTARPVYTARPVNTAWPVYTAHPKPTLHSARPMSHFYNLAQSTVKRPFYKKTTLTNSPQHVGFGDLPDPMVHHLFSTDITTLMHEADPSFVDSGCSRHMTGNIAYLSNFKEFDGGYVTFGGGSYGCRITGNGILKTDNLDFDDLPDENQIILKIPRKDNMYSFDVKNIVPKESLTCLVAKATSYESMLWHRRLGHINFKNINKLVKENLVRGLPLKCFENDQTCVACLKGKQHRASCKSKVLNPITKPLFMLHMDLFGPTIMSSLMHKKYCLVVTDDYSTFTWVFFLATKDETSEILKTFIKEIENLVDKKVKIIKYDNGTEFKNKVMNDFCKEKGTMSNEYAGTQGDLNSSSSTQKEQKSKDDSSLKDDNTADQQVNTASFGLNTGSIELNTATPEDMSSVLTRRMTKPSSKQGFLSVVYEEKTHKDLHTCLFACFLSQEEPKRITKALSDPAWVEAMQEELLQFKL